MITLTAHTVIQSVGFGLMTSGLEAFIAGITTTLLLCTLTGFTLYAVGRQSRLIQTLSALAGTVSLIWFLGLPLMGWVVQGIAHDSDTAIAELLVIILLGWNLTVHGNIFRHALSLPLFLGLLVSILIFIISTYVVSFVPPEAIKVSPT